MAPTVGFNLSALPRAPEIPSRIGQIDAREIYDTVRTALTAAEQTRSSTGRAILSDEQMRTGVAEAQARQDVLPTLTQTTLTDTPMRSRLLAQEVAGAPVRNRLLAAQAIGAENTIAANEEAQRRATTLRMRAAAEMPKLLEEREQANKLAGFNESAAALGALRVKYPWLSLPEFKDTIGKSLDDEQDAALKAAAAQAERESRETIANRRATSEEAQARTRAEATKTAAALRGGTSAMLVRQAELIEAVSLFPDDPVLSAQLDSVNAALRNVQASEMKNPNAAKATPPAGLVLLRNQEQLEAVARAAQATLTAALESGDPETIAGAQAEYNDASAKAQSAKREWELYHAERSKKVSGAIDQARIDALTSALTGGKPRPQTLPGRPADPAAKTVTPQTLPGRGGKVLTPEEAKKYLTLMNGDRAKAEEAARKDGWSF